MNILEYTTGWYDKDNIGNATTAFTKDYLNQNVWNMPVNRIPIIRHQEVRIVITLDEKVF